VGIEHAAWLIQHSPPSTTTPTLVQTWREILLRFHCSTHNYVRLCKLGNERSCYYRALVITTRRHVCLKDCLGKVRLRVAHHTPPPPLRTSTPPLHPARAIQCACCAVGRLPRP
jgi:hypothetical protein